MKITFATLAVVVLLPFRSFEAEGKEAAAGISPISWNGHSSIELPLTLDSRGLPTVPVRISGRDATAYIDSGATTSSMTPAMAATAGVQSLGLRNVNGRKFETAGNVSVELGPASIKLHAVTISGLPAKTELLLGMELFLQAVVDFDFDAGRLTLIRPDAFTAPASKPVSLQVRGSTLLNMAQIFGLTEPVTVQMRGSVPIQLKVNDHQHTIDAFLDTGTNAGILLTAKVVSELALPRDLMHMIARTGFGGERQVVPSLAALEEVRIGDQIYRNVPAYETPEDQAGPFNFLGMPVLSRHHLIFDLQRNRVWLLPRSGDR
jgi:predicted aspartyl protease